MIEAHDLSKRYPDIEAVNFGVDGYGMGQSLLRFKKVRDHIGYDFVLFLLKILAPSTVDLHPQ